jgi:hypothetical protein
MDKEEAAQIAKSILYELRRETYQELQRFTLEHPDTREVVGPSAKRYQVEVVSFWDDHPNGNLRVSVAIDDSGWRALMPLSWDFIMAPDGSFVGE